MDPRSPVVPERSVSHGDGVVHGGESLPGGDEPIAVALDRAGFDRRTVLRWCAYMAGVLALPVVPYADRIAHALAVSPRLPVLWLNGQDCTGDMEAFLRAADPTPSDLILNKLSLDYSELLMAPSGQAAEDRIAATIAGYAGQYVLVVEGSIPTAANGTYCCTGGRSFTSLVQEAAAASLVVVAAGSCAADGGLPKAAGGVTGASSVAGVLTGSGKKIITLPGCPMNPANLTATLVQYLTLGTWPATDTLGRPLFAYGSRIHPNCPRLPFFKANKFVRAWGDAGHQAGWCLKDMGCQGPQTYANCPQVKFNSAASFPITAGAPCLGCTTGGFWDLLNRAFAAPAAVAEAVPAAVAGEPSTGDGYPVAAPVPASASSGGGSR